MATIIIPIPSKDFDPTEAAVPWAMLCKAGHIVHFATPDGRPGAADDIMITGEGLDLWGFIPGLKKLVLFGRMLRANADGRRAYAAMIASPEFRAPIPWDAARAENYEGLILPGGHRARGMRAYLESDLLKNLVVAFFRADKPVGAICHGVLLAARAVDPLTGKSVLAGRKTTSLTWSLERSGTLVGRVVRFWDPTYYRTYTEAAGQPSGTMSVQAEVTRALASSADYLDVPTDDPQYRRKTSGLARDSEEDTTPAFVVRDGNYISARWPGDAHGFAKAFAGLLNKEEDPQMLYEIPAEITAYLATLDDFIEREIKPIENRDDNIRFFDHRREDARTDWDREGLPNEEWWALLGEMRAVADKAGHYRYSIPAEFGGQDGSNLSMAVIRHHLAHKGLGLHNDLQNESSVVGNLVQVLMLRDFGTDQQKRDYIPQMLDGKMGWAFGLTEEHHGSDATHMDTVAVPEVRDGVAGYRIDGNKMWITGVHKTSHVMTFARTSGVDGKARGITCLVVPCDAPGFEIGQYMWTFNMPTDHAKIRYNGVWVPESAILGKLDEGLALAQHFVHENRIRQAASSLGAAQYCIDESVKYALTRKPFGKALATNQAIQFPLVELQTDAEMLRLLIYKTAAEMDTMTKPEVAIRLSDKVSMCNYKANRLCCNAADFAMQVHGGMGYSRHKPFEHIYRHHRRYRITEGSEEIQMRKVAGHLFGFMG